MSDTSQGEGWWVASDGKWYAPEVDPEVDPEVEPEVANKRHRQFVMLAIAVVAALWVYSGVSNRIWPDKASPADQRRNYETLVFCQNRATGLALSSHGLHSTGGKWWVDRVNDCLLSKD